MSFFKGNLLVGLLLSCAGPGLLGGALLSGCKKSEPFSPVSQGSQGAAATATQKGAGINAGGGRGAGEGRDNGPGQGAGRGQSTSASDQEEHERNEGGGMPQVAQHKGEMRTTESGQKVLHLGQELQGANLASVPEVLEHPDRYLGQRIALEGNVGAMCEKRRRWFALIDADTGKYLRLFTVPVFLVPPGSIGKSFRAEGVVEWMEVPAANIRQIAKEHHLGDASKATGKFVKELVVKLDVTELW